MLSTVREQARGLTKDQRNAFLAAYLGWAMDAFDYFLVVLVYSEIADEFKVSLTDMAFLTTVTLIMRPVGAFVFGLWADRRGRRVPLMVDVLFYSVVGFACAFAPNYTVLLVLRLLYGIGMGGEWGLGAALAMEKIPPEKRGFWSGMLQGGYSFGYLLAAVAFLFIEPAFGWRGLFAFSLLPALVALFVRTRVEESEVWERTVRLNATPAREIFRDPAVLRRFVYLVALMTAFNWMSHGTQDVYPTFIKKGLGMSADTAIVIAIIYNIGAMIGGPLLGAYSERLGRRRVIVIAAAAGLLVVPVFALSTTAGWLAFSAFMMQLCVQGAWGVIPAHLNELSPDAIRGFYPGVTYQLGNLIAALNLPIQETLAKHYSYPTALMGTVFPILAVVILLSAFGKEARGVRFGSAATPSGLT
ncbi:MFS transporter [Streptantibioticus ferralitis]|uniref:MFS transporter n=1 Tax=Streptantibioticus ferralitis TaxID=236510 RepID=A0ABT5Z7X9_9ACTN|nr:MFS transporter [Streptantibioticus ferralitis]MDF2259909.1 MFS transporter [Streptantibioticus ferralitis]